MFGATTRNLSLSLAIGLPLMTGPVYAQNAVEYGYEGNLVEGVASTSNPAQVGEAFQSTASLALDSDGDGIPDGVDNCPTIANPSGIACDTDTDGFGNLCDGDFNEDGFTDATDFLDYFLPDFAAGVDGGTGTDMDCDGVVGVVDFSKHFIANFVEGKPGPASDSSQSVIVAKKTKALDGKTFVFEKHQGSDGQTWTVVRDDADQVVEEETLPVVAPPILGEELAKLLEELEGTSGNQTPILVGVALELTSDPAEEASQTGSVETLGGKVMTATIDGKEVSETELNLREETRASERALQLAEAVDARRKQLEEWAHQYGLMEMPGVKEALESTSTGLVLELLPEQIKQLSQTKDGTVRGIELYQEGKDQVGGAMVATNISAWALPFPNRRANGVGIYMTENGCANEARFANYDRLSGAETNHSRNVGGILKAVAPEHYLYCRGGAVLPTIFDLYGATWNDFLGISVFPELSGPQIQVINRSNGADTGTSYRTLDRSWDNFVYDHLIPAFNAAGNSSATASNRVFSPAKGLNIVAVGNYNDATNTIWGSSVFVDPETGNEKPELSAPGRSIAAGGFTMTGTSQASPHAAAFAADQMSDSTWLKFKPHLVKAKMISGATDAIGGGRDRVGLGGIDFLSGHYNGYNYWWSGGNGAFGPWDNADGVSDGFVTRRRYISSSWNSVRVVLSWLTRGTYTYDNRTAAYPIGIDLDLQVFDPNGVRVGSSLSWDNNFESVEFEPAMSGTYTFKISRYANRDTANRLRMGLVVNYFN